MYVMNVGLDLRLVDTNTLEVVDVISYQKQIIGRQVSAGVFDFLGTNFFDVSAGESALEPIQLAVRSVIERAVLEMVSPHLSRPGRRLRLADRHLGRSAGRCRRPALSLCASQAYAAVSAALPAALSVSAALLQPQPRLQPGELQ